MYINTIYMSLLYYLQDHTRSRHRSFNKIHGFLCCEKMQIILSSLIISIIIICWSKIYVRHFFLGKHCRAQYFLNQQYNLCCAVFSIFVYSFTLLHLLYIYTCVNKKNIRAGLCKDEKIKFFFLI